MVDQAPTPPHIAALMPRAVSMLKSHFMVGDTLQACARVRGCCALRWRRHRVMWRERDHSGGHGSRGGRAHCAETVLLG